MRLGSVPIEIKRIETQTNIDEKVSDPLDGKLRVSCISRPPLDYGEGIPYRMSLNTFPSKSELSEEGKQVLISLV